jgi:hypothetical protein
MSIRRIVIAATVVAGLVCAVKIQAAGPAFRSLRGTYGLSGSGTIGFGTVQAAVVGLNSFDRGGGCDVSAKINAGGIVTPVTTAHCRYAVNGDGTGVIDVTFNEAPFTIPFHSDFVIVDGANELRFVLSDALHSTVATGVAKRQAFGE